VSRNIRIYEVQNTDLLFIITDNNKSAEYYDKKNMTVKGVDGRIVLTNNGAVILSAFPYDFLLPLENSLVDLAEIIQRYLDTLLPTPPSEIQLVDENGEMFGVPDNPIYVDSDGLANFIGQYTQTELFNLILAELQQINKTLKKIYQ
jgi:hypothetical protein